VFEIGGIPQMRIQIAYDVEDELRLLIALFTVLDGEHVCNHFVNVPAIFGYDEL
jgi:hypothetical protein